VHDDLNDSCPDSVFYEYAPKPLNVGKFGHVE
jgi:hypothetical protein